MSDTSDLRAGSQERELMGHPIGLSICFLTEMWERFSFYGMRALLILFLTKYYLYSTEQSSGIYGAYIGMTYMLPILGGYLADRYLGSRKAVVFGGILLVLGHLSLAFEGPPAYLDGETVVRDEGFQSLFFFSLALIITGVGFLKANISTIVGKLYGENDPRRDGGFTIFYMGINVGSVLSIFGVGYVGETFGWSYGFGMAGIGMLFGLLVFLWGQKFLDGRAEPPKPEALKEKAFGPVNKENAIYLFGFGLVLLSWVLIQYRDVLGQALGILGILMVVILVGKAMKSETVVRGRLLVATFLIVVQTVFWALFEQQGASLTLLADQYFDLNFLGFEWLPSQVQSMNPAFIIMFAPVFSWLWVTLSKKGYEPSTPGKFGWAMFIIGAGYLVFAYGLGADEGSNKSFIWLVFLYLGLTLSELCLSPVGLSMVTKLSPKEIVGMVMGTFFLFISLGNYLVGIISSLTGGAESHGAAAGAVDVASTITVFNNVGLLAVGTGVLIFILTPLMKRHMHGIH